MTRVDSRGDRQVADHAASSCPHGVCWWDYTYNQGVGIGAAIELNHITGDASYVSEAHQMASFMIHDEVQGGVLHDHGSCRGDCPAFKGIAYRFLLKLYEMNRLSCSTARSFPRAPRRSGTTPARRRTTSSGPSGRAPRRSRRRSPRTPPPSWR